MLDTKVYDENIEFWARAWGGVKVPYTQMPDLPYLPEIPVRLKESGCKTVLDLGCGSGWLSIYLARAGFEVTGIDLAEHALRLASQWAEQENLSAKFEVADIAKLPYADRSFDAVVANSILEHLTFELAEEMFGQLKRVLKPGGVLFGCFDKVGGGPGDYYELEDGTHVYTDKGRKGMLLRYFTDGELKDLLSGWKINTMETIDTGSRIIWAQS
jgi:SAM-dependent methyltransferase